MAAAVSPEVRLVSMGTLKCACTFLGEDGEERAPPGLLHVDDVQPTGGAAASPPPQPSRSSPYVADTAANGLSHLISPWSVHCIGGLDSRTPSPASSLLRPWVTASEPLPERLRSILWKTHDSQVPERLSLAVTLMECAVDAVEGRLKNPVKAQGVICRTLLKALLMECFAWLPPGSFPSSYRLLSKVRRSTFPVRLAYLEQIRRDTELRLYSELCGGFGDELPAVGFYSVAVDRGFLEALERDVTPGVS